MERLEFMFQTTKQITIPIYQWWYINYITVYSWYPNDIPMIIYWYYNDHPSI